MVPSMPLFGRLPLWSGSVRRGAASRGKPARAPDRLHVLLEPLERRYLLTSVPMSPTPVPVPITGLFNTGVDSSGAATAAGTVDSHYTVVASADGSGNAFSVGPNGTFPIPPWVPDVAGAGGYNWISGPLPGPAAETNGPFDYQTHFTVNSTGAISISGMLSADDQVTQIEINGVAATTTGLPTTDQGYGSVYPFTASISSGGILGPNANTLDFIVSNTHLSVEGLLVSQIAGTTAGPIVVNTAGDPSINSPGVVSLRDAVNMVNGGSPSHDITFAPGLGAAPLMLNRSARWN